MKIVAPILALTLAVASFSSAPVGAVVAADTCAVPAKTLVFDKCGKSCQSGSPCMSNVSCKIECFDASYITRKSTQKREFWFLVQFGKWKSEQEKANEKWLPKSEVDKYSMSGKKSNDDLTAIGAIKVPADANGVVIRGGASDVETIKSRVANVDFEPDFLAESKHVTIVKLENLNLAKSADKLLANFPPKVEVVSFSNGLLTEVPTNIAKFKTLQELDLSHNYITSVPSDIKMANLTKLDLTKNNFTSLPTALSTVTELILNNNSISSVASSVVRDTLTTLELRANKLSKFEGSFKSLTKLDLSNNELTEVPAAIEKFKNLETLILSFNKITHLSPVLFKLPKLKTLLIGDNPLKDVSLTKAQAEVFKTLKLFAIDYDDVKRGCAAAQEVKVGFEKLCITETGSTKAKGVHVRYHHHHHHHHHHRVHESEAEAAAAQEPATAANEVTATMLSAAAAAPQKPTSSVADDELAVALSSAAGGVMAVVAAILAVAIHKKLRAASAASAADAGVRKREAEDEEEQKEGDVEGVQDSASL